MIIKVLNTSNYEALELLALSKKLWPEHSFETVLKRPETPNNSQYQREIISSVKTKTKGDDYFISNEEEARELYSPLLNTVERNMRNDQ